MFYTKFLFFIGIPFFPFSPPVLDKIPVENDLIEFYFESLTEYSILLKSKSIIKPINNFCDEYFLKNYGAPPNNKFLFCIDQKISEVNGTLKRNDDQMSISINPSSKTKIFFTQIGKDLNSTPIQKLKEFKFNESNFHLINEFIISIPDLNILVKMISNENNRLTQFQYSKYLKFSIEESFSKGFRRRIYKVIKCKMCPSSTLELEMRWTDNDDEVLFYNMKENKMIDPYQFLQSLLDNLVNPIKYEGQESLETYIKEFNWPKLN